MAEPPNIPGAAVPNPNEAAAVAADLPAVPVAAVINAAVDQAPNVAAAGHRQPAAFVPIAAAAGPAAHQAPVNVAAAAPAARRRARRGGNGNGRAAGRRNYSHDELECLLQNVRELLPISGADWEVIESRHSTYFPECERTWEHLKKKFWSLTNKSMPTGDPSIPWEVREAEEIRRLIIERTEGARGSPSEGFDFAREDDGSVGEEDAIGAVYGNGGQGAGEGGGAAAAAAALNRAGVPTGNSNAIPPRYVPNFRLGNMLDRIPFNHDNDDPDLQDPETSRRRANPTPITRRNQRARRGDSPSFNEVMMLMMNQQTAEREEAREERRLRQQEQASAMQMQQTMMSSMMMLMMQQLPRPTAAALPIPGVPPVVMPPPAAAVATNSVNVAQSDADDESDSRSSE